MGMAVASGGDDDAVRLWNSTDGSCMRVLRGHLQGVTSLVPIGGGKLVSGSDDYELRVWDTFEGSCQQILVGHRGWISCLAKLGDDTVISGSEDNTLIVWDCVEGDGNPSMVLGSDKPSSTSATHQSWITAVVRLRHDRW